MAKNIRNGARKVKDVLYRPGPKYMLPPVIGYDEHCATKKRYPAYSMGLKLPSDRKPFGPGPQYVIPYNFTRFGPDGTPEYTLKSRISPKQLDDVPGPGRYKPEEFTNKVKKRAPAHVLAGRTEQKKDDIKPAPCDYSIPSSIGKSQPAYSMKFRRDKVQPTRSPGPAAYGTPYMKYYKPQAPVYSMGGRRPPLGDKSQQPPFYNVKYRTGKQPPSYSFGVRHTEFTVPLILKEDAYPCD